MEHTLGIDEALGLDETFTDILAAYPSHHHNINGNHSYSYISVNNCPESQLNTTVDMPLSVPGIPLSMSDHSYKGPNYAMTISSQNETDCTASEDTNLYLYEPHLLEEYAATLALLPEAIEVPPDPSASVSNCFLKHECMGNRGELQLNEPIQSNLNRLTGKYENFEMNSDHKNHFQSKVTERMNGHSNEEGTVGYKINRSAMEIDALSLNASRLPHTLNENSLKSVSAEPTDLSNREVKRSERLLMQCKSHEREKDYSEMKIIHDLKDNRRYSCRVCRKKFTSKNSVKIHHHVHTGERPFECNECSKKFLKKSDLHIHQRNHTGEKPHICLECGNSFKLLSTLKSHILTHTGEQPYMCDVCESRFSQRSSLARHKMTHTDAKPYKCDSCGNCFQNKDYIKKHLQNHELKAQHSCRICGIGFRNSERLELHLVTHNGAPKPFKCNRCFSCFASLKQLRQHVRRVHGRDKHELRCEECDAMFKRKEYLKAHKRVHGGDSVFQCEVCKASFNHSGTHRKHLRRHWKEELYQKNVTTKILDYGSDIFSCLKCKRIYKTQRQFKAHKCHSFQR